MPAKHDPLGQRAPESRTTHYVVPVPAMDSAETATGEDYVSNDLSSW